jgi:hypothetical protein
VNSRTAPTRQAPVVQPIQVIGTPMEGSGATVGVIYPGYCGSPVIAQKSRYDRFPPVTNGWRTMHLVLDMAPPLLAEEEGPPTQRIKPRSNPC